MKYVLNTPYEQLVFDNEKALENAIISECCTKCIVDLFLDIPTEDMLQMTRWEMISELLMTDCGAEMIVGHIADGDGDDD